MWNNIRGSGHLSTINGIIKKLTKQNLKINIINNEKIKDHLIEYDFTYYYIIEYLSKILEKYTNNGKIDLMEYFENIFLKNIDIWGFTMIYVILYEKFYEFYGDLNMKFMDKIKYIIIHYLFENPISRIDVSSLVKELTNLNTIIEHINLSDKGGFLKKTKTNKHIKNKKQVTKKRR
jgi:hypothetical protein